jgi:hypothetical protein
MDDITLGEVHRSLELMRQDISGLRDSVVKRDDLTSAASAWTMLLQSHEQIAEQRHKELNNRITALESWQTWAMRIVLGAVMAGVLALVLVQP